MTLTHKQKKLLWIAAGGFAVIHFAPAVLHQVAPLIAFRHQNAPKNWKPSPSIAAAQPGHSPLAASVSPFPPAADGSQADPAAAMFFRNHLGTYMGAGLIGDRGICRLGLDLRLDLEKPGYYTGYSTMACGPSGPFVKQQPGMDRGTSQVLNEMTTTSAILEGQIVGRSITFNVEQAIGKSLDGCGITSYRATPFSDGIAVEWQEGTCCNGQMVLVRKS
jgi:hypothetical protein